MQQGRAQKSAEVWLPLIRNISISPITQEFCVLRYLRTSLFMIFHDQNDFIWFL